MPIYEYEVVGESCRVCGGIFELRRPLGRPELTSCPLCRKAVRRVVSAPHTPKVLKPLSVSEARRAGFSVFKKAGQGVYERQ